MFTDKPKINQVCVFEDDEHILTYPIDAILKHANAEVCKTYRYLPLDTLLWAIEPTVELWEPLDTLYHFKRMINADLSYPILIHETAVVDGVHRILKAALLGKSMLKVHDLRTLPPCPNIKAA